MRHSNYHKLYGCILIVAICVSLFICKSANAFEDNLSTLPYIVDVNERPDPRGTPTEVSIGIYVIDVSDIDDIEQTFTADFAIRLKWKDPRLALKDGDEPQGTRRFLIGDIWHPKMLILNDRDVEKRWKDVVEVDDEGHAVYTQLFYGNLGFKLDLKNFPFDEHALEIKLASSRYDPSQIQFIINEKFTGKSQEFTVADWTFSKWKTGLESYYFAPKDKSYSVVDYELDAYRRSGFFVWRVIVPLILIVFMSWMVFWIDPSHLEAQVGVSATSVLTLVAFQFAVGVLLPRVSYLTRIDRFLILTSIIVFCALVEGVVTSALASKGKHATAIKIDRWSRVLFPLTFLLFIIISFVL